MPPYPTKRKKLGCSGNVVPHFFSLLRRRNFPPSPFSSSLFRVTRGPPPPPPPPLSFSGGEGVGLSPLPRKISLCPIYLRVGEEGGGDLRDLLPQFRGRGFAAVTRVKRGKRRRRGERTTYLVKEDPSALTVVSGNVLPLVSLPPPPPPPPPQKGIIIRLSLTRFFARGKSERRRRRRRRRRPQRKCWRWWYGRGRPATPESVADCGCGILSLSLSPSLFSFCHPESRHPSISPRLLLPFSAVGVWYGIGRRY